MYIWSEHVRAHSRAAGTFLALGMILAERADVDGVAWPSVMTLATETKRTRRAVQLGLRRLEELGELITVTGCGLRKATGGNR